MGNELNIIQLSYGKDSLALFPVCEMLGIPIHGAVHAEVWATDDIPADLPPMVEFKAKADEIIKQRWGIEVQHVCAMTTADKKYNPNFPMPLNVGGYKCTYEDYFYHVVGDKTIKRRIEHYNNNQKSQTENGNPIYGFPCVLGAWCNSKLKVKALETANNETNLRRFVLQGLSERLEGGQIQGFPMSTTRGNYCTGLKTNIRISNEKRELVYELKDKRTKFSEPCESEVVRLLGIASDEPERIAKHKDKVGFRMPLVEANWTEKMCREWCEKNDLLSPIYTDASRGGCWFCHNQSVDQLRKLRKNYPDLWKLLLKWDSDSPITFHADGHTVHDFDKRFRLEDLGKVLCNERWRWKYIKEPPERQYTIFDCYDDEGNLKV